MNREDIIRMARGAGLEGFFAPNWDYGQKIERFAALVAAHEREACAEMVWPTQQIKVWSDKEINAMTGAFNRGQEKHGWYETLMAVGAAALKNRAAALRDRLAEPGTWREVTYDQLMEEVRNRGYEIRDAKITALRQARSLTDELMDCVDRLGSEADTVDPRVWQHLLVYAPKQEPVAWADAIIDDLQGLFDTDGITEQDSGDALIRLSDAIAAVEDEKKRYTAPPKQEPVAFINVEKQKLEWAKLTSWHTPTIVNLPKIPLYTAPPKKEWVGLTDEEFKFIASKYSFQTQTGMEYFKDELEAKLKEKNHG